MRKTLGQLAANPIWQAILLCTLFVLLGLGAFLFSPPQIDPGDDYPGKAINILEGKGLSDRAPHKDRADIQSFSLISFWREHNLTFGTYHPNQPTAFWEPGYPLWLALMFWLFGYYSPVVNVFQIFMMGSVILLVYFTAYRIYPQTWMAFVAGLILSVHPSLIRYPSVYPSECLYIPLMMAGVAACYWCAPRATPVKILLFSLAWALAGLTRMVGIYLSLLACIAFFLAYPRWWKYSGLATLTFLLIWGSWMYRNASAVGQARLFPTKMGYDLWDSNNRHYLDNILNERRPDIRLALLDFTHPDSRAVLIREFGLTDEQIDALKRYDYPAEAIHLDEVGIDKLLKGSFQLFLKERPALVLRFAVERFFQSFSQTLMATRPIGIGILPRLYFGLLFGLGLAGIVIALLNLKRFWFLILLILTSSVAIAGGTWGSRFRLPLDPLLAICAALAVWTMVQSIRFRSLRWRL